MSDGPLQGIRILDLTQGVTGPYATKLFSDYGAEVLKVEHPDRGDVSRRLGPFPGDVPNRETSGMFMELNTGKRSVTLNLKTRSGQQLLRRLAADADLVIESFRPGTAARLGLSDDDLTAANPRAGYVHISNFGQSGPYRDFEADDMLAYAMSGILAVTAEYTREPVKIGLYAPLFLAGGVAAAFSMGAFNSGRRNGVGERADFSIHEMLTTSMDRGGTNLLAYQYSGSLFFERTQSSRTTALPTGVYPCADGYVTMLVSPNWWDRFCHTIDRPDLIEDQQFVPNLLNIDFAPEVDALFYPWLLERTKQQVMEAGQKYGLPISAINNAADVARDPALQARGFWTPIDHPVAGTVTMPGLPFRMLGTPGALRPPPLLGQHTFQVLTEQLGLAPENVARLRQTNIV